jgi:hypothetical protein
LYIREVHLSLQHRNVEGFGCLQPRKKMLKDASSSLIPLFFSFPFSAIPVSAHGVVALRIGEYTT